MKCLHEPRPLVNIRLGRSSYTFGARRITQVSISTLTTPRTVFHKPHFVIAQHHVAALGNTRYGTNALAIAATIVTRRTGAEKAVAPEGWAELPPLISVASKGPFVQLKPSVSCSPGSSDCGSQRTLASSMPAWLGGSTSMFTNERLRAAGTVTQPGQRDWQGRIPVSGYKSMMTDCVPSIPWT